MGLVDTSGNSVASYTYDPYGKVLTATGILAEKNPLRYRGYYYDKESGFYYLQSRYYDPATRRFINADSYSSTGQGLLGCNMFAYCNNNPLTGYDPFGMVNWGGFIVGVGLIATAMLVAATAGIATPIVGLAVAAAATTGAVMAYSAATEGTMVVDVSITTPSITSGYAKTGESVVIDFSESEAYCYEHVGAGVGTGGGLTYSVGVVENFTGPDDYAGSFVDVSAGDNVGIDHCWGPQKGAIRSTQATCVTFSSGISYGVGYDYFSSPKPVLAW